MYEKYPGSINDVSQLQFMLEKVKGYGYKNIGFILDRGYFSKENLRFMDSNGFEFIIMVKVCKEFICNQIRKQKGAFENDWGNQNKIYRFDHAVSKTQKVVLSAFRISVEQVKYQSNYISDSLKGKGLGE